MVIDLSDVTPFLTWLLGPGWAHGAIFHPVLIVLVLGLLLAGAIWAVAALRKGEGSTSRRGGAIVAAVLAAVMILVAVGAVSWGIAAVNAARAAKQAAGAGQPAVESPLVTWVGKPLVQILGDQWYEGALYQWLGVIFCAAGAAFFIGWLLTALRRGPVSAFVRAGQVAGDCALDLVRLSPRRVGALAWLAVKEAIRRRIVVVLAVFIILLLFAGWYLDPGSTNPARLYLDFVLDEATLYPLLLLVLFLSSLSLPADIKNRTLHTIVTKPVRASEIVLGRIVGFTAVATVLLVVMGAISYGFVVRGLAHTHEVELSSLKPLEEGLRGRPGGLEGRTSEVNSHRHHLTIDASGRGRVEPEQGHTHLLTTVKENGRDVYRLGPPIGELSARVPLYGKLRFLNEKGQPTDKGICVGDEWMYRSFIAGGSAAAAIWTFEGVGEEAFPKGLPVDLTISVFRTYKGDIEKVVRGSLSVRNPQTGRTALVRIFDSKDREIDEQLLPRQWKTSGKKTVDLFRDFVHDGQVEVILQCADVQQYFGMAQGDMYLRAAEGSFEWNFLKGYLGIWLQVVLVVSLGVTYSTFLSGPVAMMATLGTLLGGFFHDFMYRLATNQTYGGGPFESLIRIFTQENMTSELEPGLRSTVAQGLDQVAEFFLRLITAILPDLRRFSFSEFVASGFNIPFESILLTYACRTLAFALPVFIAGYLCMKNREIAQL